ncbi:MAG: hypothetical protein J5903_01300 [Clostridia bacterium]|nr:hypothetical protein [Clostridia bacterium]
MKIYYDGYKGVCDAKGCDRTGEIAVSFHDVETDVHLCERCADALDAELKKFRRKKKTNDGQ